MPEQASCAACPMGRGERICRNPDTGRGPDFCPTLRCREILEQAKGDYRQPEIGRFALKAIRQESDGYSTGVAGPRRAVKPRLQELLEFIDRMDYSRIGLAYCSGLQQEAGELTSLLEGLGLTVVSVACGVGQLSAAELEGTAAQGDADAAPGGRGDAHGDGGRIVCNPLGQAEILNRAGTEFNIMMGLCVGHDALFLGKVQAPTTVFAVKDRVTGHNPLAALYLSRSYYRWLRRPRRGGAAGS